MPLSEDALSIVASNLTIAHCSLARTEEAAPPALPVDEGLKTVAKIYGQYLIALKKGEKIALDNIAAGRPAPDIG